MPQSVRIAVAAAVLLATAGCSSMSGSLEDQSQPSATSSAETRNGRETSTPTPDTSSEDDQVTESESNDLPVEAAISEIAGYSEIDVATAVNNARFESILSCMTSEGWDYGYDDLPDTSVITEPISYFGDQIQYYLDQINSPQGGEATDGTNDADDPRASAEFEQDQFECWVQAEDEYPDPLQTLWTWLANETEDLNTRVNQDPRLVAATDESAICIGASGYDISSIEEAANHFNGLASEVWERLQAGDVTADEAYSELLALSGDAAEVEQHVRSCDARLAEIAGEVRRDHEQAFLEENGDRIALIAQDYAELLDPYLEYLR